MSMEQIQKKKTKKSYAQLLKEFEELGKKVAVVYVKQLCEALRDENPNMLYSDIREKVFEDCTAIGWGGKTGSTIYHNLPSWLIEDDPNHKRVVKNWETRHANMLKSSAETAEKLNRQLPPPPPEPKERPIDEEVDQEMHELGIAKFGDSDKSIRELKGRIYQSATDLFEALTDKETPPDESDDLIVDYIKPTREFRRSLILELDEGDRTLIHNKLHYANVAIEDMIKIISEVKDK